MRTGVAGNGSVRWHDEGERGGGAKGEGERARREGEDDEKGSEQKLAERARRTCPDRRSVPASPPRGVALSHSARSIQSLSAQETGAHSDPKGRPASAPAVSVPLPD